MDKIIPPVKAAQVEIPAKSPKKKKAGKDEEAETLTNPDKPRRFSSKNPAKTAPAMTTEINNPFELADAFVFYAGNSPASHKQYPSPSSNSLIFSSVGRLSL